MQVSFILVEPAVPENIGAAARAIKTMGFHDLRLVNPGNHLAEEAKWLAHGSVDVLEQASVYGDLTGATENIDFLIGTTAKKRSTKNDYYTPEQSRKLIEIKRNLLSNIGIVFGREESGLSNEELSHCDIASTIPIFKPYPSINLAQSVMIYAYVFSDLKPVNENVESPSLNTSRLYNELKKNAGSILDIIDIDNHSVLRHRMMERLATANEDNARLFLSFAKKFRQKFE